MNRVCMGSQRGMRKHHQGTKLSQPQQRQNAKPIPPHHVILYDITRTQHVMALITLNTRHHPHHLFSLTVQNPHAAYSETIQA